jgi:hypothetical protein
VHADQAEAILRGGRADLCALAREIMYNPNWPMDAAQKLGADPDFKLVPPPYSYWLGKRAKSAFEGTPSTWTAGLGGQGGARARNDVIPRRPTAQRAVGRGTGPRPHRLRAAVLGPVPPALPQLGACTG